MPSEYRPATVTSGDVRARISGDAVNISGVTVDVLVSGEVVQISGQSVIANMSGQAVTLESYEEAEDGTVTAGSTIPKGTGLGYLYNDALNRWERVKGQTPDDTLSTFIEEALIARTYGFDDANWMRARTVFGATVSGGQVLGAGLLAHDAGPGLLRRLEVIGSGLPALAVGTLSGQYIAVSGSIAANMSGSVVQVSGMIEAVQLVTVDNIDPTNLRGRTVQAFGYVFDSSTTEWNRMQAFEPLTVNPESILGVGLRALDANQTLGRALETVASGEPILMVGHASGQRLISVSSQLISSGGQTYTGAALTFALGKFTAFALYNTVDRSGASGQTVETQVQFSDDFGTTWYDLVDGPFGNIVYEGQQVGSFGTLRDVQTGKTAGPGVRVFVRTSGSTLNGSNNFTLSSFAMLLNN